MVRYEYFMVDADDTILDYKQAEINAINKVFNHINMECNIKAGEVFGDICKELWSLYKLDNVNDEIVQAQYHSLYYEYQIERFRKLKMEFDFDILAEELSELYLNSFAEETVAICHAEEVCAKISAVCKLIIITNGLTRIQLSRLGMFKPYIYKTYVSEEIGFINQVTDTSTMLSTI